MDDFLKLDSRERNFLFQNASTGNGNQSAIIEKDFWMCWTLKYLFAEFAYRNYITFKGGTCLSKVYSAINRFSAMMCMN